MFNKINKLKEEFHAAIDKDSNVDALKLKAQEYLNYLDTDEYINRYTKEYINAYELCYSLANFNHNNVIEYVSRINTIKVIPVEYVDKLDKYKKICYNRTI